MSTCQQLQRASVQAERASLTQSSGLGGLPTATCMLVLVLYWPNAQAGGSEQGSRQAGMHFYTSPTWHCRLTLFLLFLSSHFCFYKPYHMSRQCRLASSS